jgi:hypothetical protein
MYTGQPWYSIGRETVGAGSQLVPERVGILVDSALRALTSLSALGMRCKPVV